MEEDTSKLRVNLLKTEKQLKELQMKDSRKDSDILLKQLQMKSQEANAYQTELANQRSENSKLRDKIKELMSRGRTSSTGDSSELLRVQQEKDTLLKTMDNLKQQFKHSL